LNNIITALNEKKKEILDNLLNDKITKADNRAAFNGLFEKMYSNFLANKNKVKNLNDFRKEVENLLDNEENKDKKVQEILETIYALYFNVDEIFSNVLSNSTVQKQLSVIKYESGSLLDFILDLLDRLKKLIFNTPDGSLQKFLEVNIINFI